jgi:hypothetical protein
LLDSVPIAREAQHDEFGALLDSGDGGRVGVSIPAGNRKSHCWVKANGQNIQSDAGRDRRGLDIGRGLVFARPRYATGQPPLTVLNQGNLSGFHASFDAAAPKTRLVLLLSPT